MPDTPARPKRGQRSSTAREPAKKPVEANKAGEKESHSQVSNQEIKSGTVSYAIAALITTPISFFSLMAMIIEGIFAVMVVKSNLTPLMQFSAFCIMAFLFLVLIVTVGYLTFQRPRHLSKDMANALEKSDQIQEFLNGPAFKDNIAGVVEDLFNKNQIASRSGSQATPELANPPKAANEEATHEH